MKKTRIISAIMACAIIATPAMGIASSNTSKTQSHQLTAYAAKNVKQHGWVKTNGKWYYYDANGIKVTNASKKIDGKWYYFGKDGAMYTNWQKINNRWYYFGTDGAMRTGWQQINGKWYYFDSKGVMQTGWILLDGKWYYLLSDGSMLTGWLNDKGKWYYLDSNGVMLIGLQKINYKTYYFNSKGVMQSNVNIMIKGNNYHFDANGVWVNYSGAYKVTNSFAYAYKDLTGQGHDTSKIKTGTFRSITTDKNGTCVYNYIIPRDTVLTLDSFGICTSGDLKGWDFSEHVGGNNLMKIY